jgi:hypothetical protein
MAIGRTIAVAAISGRVGRIIAAAMRGWVDRAIARDAIPKHDRAAIAVTGTRESVAEVRRPSLAAADCLVGQTGAMLNDRRRG